MLISRPSNLGREEIPPPTGQPFRSVSSGRQPAYGLNLYELPTAFC